MRLFVQIITILLLSLHLSACVVVSVADTVVSTTVKVGGAVVGTAVDVTRAGVHAVTGGSGDNANSTDSANHPDAGQEQKKPGRD